ncbi:probable methyltransferase At1g27930 [Argentina anserina]|uniref:probable methyltransferase At1g27930 n=1 Tax=Argentina anserina TaxID=57926 RepID=UPI0021765800|nr:probable methyltransferase At1g27930 [Potentilla anserina]
MKYRNIRTSEKTGLLAAVLVFFIGAALFISSLTENGNSFICSLPIFGKDDHTPTPVELQAILHYATSRTTPQQSKNEISLCFEVLKSRAPCNFLVFGLGHDSLMWASFNPRGTTLFLEEDPKCVKKVLKDAPQLRAVPVSYRTQLKQADDLLMSYKSDATCMSSDAVLRGNKQCRLALSNLPDEVYEREWDLIMIDGPQGWFAEAPGRMGVIFSAAVMARRRQGPGSTHVFLHDVDRKVEKAFAEEFLCRKYLVNAVGRLWHFVIPSSVDVSDTNNASFC